MKVLKHIWFPIKKIYIIIPIMKIPIPGHQRKLPSRFTNQNNNEGTETISGFQSKNRPFSTKTYVSSWSHLFIPQLQKPHDGRCMKRSLVLAREDGEGAIWQGGNKWKHKICGRCQCLEIPQKPNARENSVKIPWKLVNIHTFEIFGIFKNYVHTSAFCGSVLRVDWSFCHCAGHYVWSCSTPSTGWCCPTTGFFGNTTGWG